MNETSQLQKQHIKAIIYCLLHYLCHQAAHEAMHVITHLRLKNEPVDYTEIFNLSLKRYLLNNDLTEPLRLMKQEQYDAVDPEILKHVRENYKDYLTSIQTDDFDIKIKKFIEAVRAGAMVGLDLALVEDFDIECCSRCESVIHVHIEWKLTTPSNAEAVVMANYIDNLDQFAAALPGFYNSV